MNGMVLQPILSLCSGAGGLDLGVHDALGGRARTVCYVEHETTACEVLATRIADGALDDAPIWTDLHAFDGRPWRGKVAGIIGGYPCQPFSVAGKRLGVNDPRHLWPSIERIIGEVEPGWCFFENVGGHLRLGYWDVVRPGIERLGYRVAQGLFTAAEVAAPHQRERLFILAHAAIGGQRERGEPSERDGQPHGGHGAVEHATRPQLAGSTGRGPDSELADAGSGQLSEPWRGAQGRNGAGPAGAEPDMGNASSAVGEGRLLGSGADEERRQEPDGHPRQPGDLLPAFPPGPGERAAWQRILAVRPDLAPAITQSDIRGVADGVSAGLDLSRAARLRLTGNAVVAPCAALAFRTLWEELI